jgi:hypothetical protein
VRKNARSKWRERSSWHRLPTGVLVVAGLALGAAACGGSGTATSTTTTTSGSTGSTSTGGNDTGSGSSGSTTTPTTAASSETVAAVCQMVSADLAKVQSSGTALSVIDAQELLVAAQGSKDEGLIAEAQSLSSSSHEDNFHATFGILQGMDGTCKDLGH